MEGKTSENVSIKIYKIIFTREKSPYFEDDMSEENLYI
jgi:hypothetical protein